MTKDDFEAAVEELNAALIREFPDPVDVFEDDLAEKLGLKRGPGMSLDEWRRYGCGSLMRQSPICQRTSSKQDDRPFGCAVRR